MMALGETWFVDTNVLLSATNERRASSDAARRLFEEAGHAGGHLALSGQILREYLVVSTRAPGENGLGLSLDDALANAVEFRRKAVFLDEPRAVSDSLARLIEKHGVTGKRIHDANVVATMFVHGISHLVTDNLEDFRHFEGLVAHPLSSL